MTDAGNDRTLAIYRQFPLSVSSRCLMLLFPLSATTTAFDSRTTSARELLRQVQASRFKQANPNLNICLDVHNRPDAPSASFVFIDDSTVRLLLVLILCIYCSVWLCCVELCTRKATRWVLVSTHSSAKLALTFVVSSDSRRKTLKRKKFR